METYEIFSLVGVALAGISVLLSVKQLRRKLTLRQQLVHRLANDYNFLAEMKRLEESKYNESKYLDEIERLQKIIVKQLDALNDLDRAQVEAPMRQSSFIGRSRYIEKIVRDAQSEAQHAA